LPTSELAAQVADIAGQLSKQTTRPMRFMEVCGTHSMAVARYRLRQLLPDNVRLISGPGCPVCVTPASEIDAAIALAKRPDVTVVTFGDMMRVPGSDGSLALARAAGGQVQVVYSPMQALELAVRRPDRHVVFIAVGFETTAPGVACAVQEAHRQQVDNFSILCSHKLIPPAMAALLESGEVAIDGFLCPGHVSTIIGTTAYEPLVRRFAIPCVVAGFEPLDIMRALAALVAQVVSGQARVENAYERAVQPEGNQKAQQLISRVFEVTAAEWRGLGVIAASGLRLREEFSHFDALKRLDIELRPVPENPACHCGEVLRGVMEPHECPAFGRACTPEHPLGPCMVSSEGSCAAAYKYR